MILVTCGTQKQQFTRLFEYVEQLNIDDEIIYQLGETKFNTKYKHYNYSDKFKEDLLRADLIITHGGVGTIMEALLNNKKVIVVPRLKKYHEHVDDHQLEITKKLADEKYIYVANSVSELEILINQLDNLEFTKYISNNKNFNKRLNEIIKKLKNDF